MDIDSPVSYIYKENDCIYSRNNRNSRNLNLSINHLNIMNQKGIASNLLKLANSSGSNTTSTSASVSNCVINVSANVNANANSIAASSKSDSTSLLTPGSNKRPLSNYFDSPTSLAADLSQNFHIKTSPTDLYFREASQFNTDSPLMNRKPLKVISNNNTSPKSCNKSPLKQNSPDSNVKSKLITKPKTKNFNKLIRSATLFENSMSRSVNKDLVEGYFVPSPILELENNFFDNNPITNFNEDELSNQISNSPLQQKRSSKLKKPIRRTHSMYQSTKEINDTNTLVENNSILHKTSIKSFKVEQDLLPRIHIDELINITEGKHKEHFDEFVIIDCRFKYEYDGGHIGGAVNIPSIELLEKKFLEDLDAQTKTRKTLLVFHCEFSLKRGPHMAAHLRKCDRLINSDNYPNLTYPDIVILDGGYKKFFDNFKTKCVPENYIEMNDSNFKETCESEMDRIRRDIKCITKSKSFHFYNHQRSNSIAITSYTKNLKILKRQKSSTFNKFDVKLNQVSNETNLQSPTNSNSSSSNSSSPRSKNHLLDIKLKSHQKSLSFSGLMASTRNFNPSYISSNSNLSLEPISNSLATNKVLASDEIASYFEKPSIHPLQNKSNSSLSNLLFNEKYNSSSSTSTLSSNSSSSSINTGFMFPLPRKNSVTNLNHIRNNTSRRSSIYNVTLSSEFESNFQESKGKNGIKGRNLFNPKFGFND